MHIRCTLFVKTAKNAVRCTWNSLRVPSINTGWTSTQAAVCLKTLNRSDRYNGEGPLWINVRTVVKHTVTCMDVHWYLASRFVPTLTLQLVPNSAVNIFTQSYTILIPKLRSKASGRYLKTARTDWTLKSALSIFVLRIRTTGFLFLTVG